MDRVDKDYELTMLKTAIDMYLDKTIAFTEEGLQLLESNRDRFVWELSTNIYVQSGHKVEFYIARDEIDSWLEKRKVQLVEFRRNQKEQARQIAEENNRRIAEEKVRREEQARQIAEEKARRIAEEKARLIKELDDLADRRLNKKINGSEKERIVKHLGKHKVGIFFELQRIIVEQLSVEENTVNLDTDISMGSDLCSNTSSDSSHSKSSYYSCSNSTDGLDFMELMMAIEEEFDVEILDEVAEQTTTVEKTVDYIYNKLQLELALLGE